MALRKKARLLKMVHVIAVLLLGCGTGATSEADAASAGQSAAILITPTSAVLGTHRSLTWSALATGTSDSSVTWSVRGSANCGSITSAGVYTAPAAPAACQVVVASSADPSLTAVAEVTVIASSTATSSANFTPSATALPADVPAVGRGAFVVFGESMKPADVRPTDVYLNIPWRNVEKAAGTYNWTQIDAAIAKATSQGGRIGVRLFPLNTSPGWASLVGTCNGGVWPLPDDMCAKVNPLMAKYSGVQYAIPDWNNTTYVARLSALVHAVAAHYAGNPRFGWFEISGYGNWGEWHLTPFADAGFYDSSTSNRTPITAATARAIADAHFSAFDATGIRLISLVDNTDLLAYAMDHSPDIGIRSDSLGRVLSWTDAGVGGPGEPFRVVPSAATRWQTAPFIGEMIQASMTDGVLWANIKEHVRKYHLSSISDNMEAVGLSSSDSAAVSLAYAESGYRLRASSVTTTLSGSGASAQVTLVNDGVAPTYDQWDLTMAWVNQATQMRLTCQLDGELRSVLPGTPRTLSCSATGSVADGVYLVSVQARDPKGVLSMSFAQGGYDTTSRSYVLGSMTLKSN